MQKKTRVGAVSYLNTKPLIYGFEQGAMHDQIELVLDFPSRLAASLQRNQIDIALLPVAAIPDLSSPVLFSNYCIAADKKVASVCLFSEVPIEDIQSIYLDYQSKTSVTLLRLLLRDYWQIRPSLLEADEHFIQKISGKTAGIIIGDRALVNLTRFPFVYDLAEAWQSHTQLPFVFATWVSNQPLSEKFVTAFDHANAIGLSNLSAIAESISFPDYDLLHYYNENISYIMDEEKRNGLQLFLRMIEKL